MPDRDELYRQLRDRYADLITRAAFDNPRITPEWVEIPYRDLASQRVAPVPMPFEEFDHRLRRNQPVEGWNLVARNRAHTAPFFTPLYETAMRYPITEYTVARLRGDSANPDTRESLWYIAEDLALMYGYYLYCHTLPSEGGSR